MINLFVQLIKEIHFIFKKSARSAIYSVIRRVTSRINEEFDRAQKYKINAIVHWNANCCISLRIYKYNIKISSVFVILNITFPLYPTDCQK